MQLNETRNLPFPNALNNTRDWFNPSKDFAQPQVY